MGGGGSQSAGETGTQLAWRTGTEGEAGHGERTLGELCEALVVSGQI